MLTADILGSSPIVFFYQMQNALGKALFLLRMNRLHVRSITLWLIVLDVGNQVTAFTSMLSVITPFFFLGDRAGAAAAEGDKQ